MNYDKYKTEIDCQIHFNECWDETLYLTLSEVEEWLDELDGYIHDKGLSAQRKLQKIVDSVTGTDNI